MRAVFCGHRMINPANQVSKLGLKMKAADACCFKTKKDRWGLVCLWLVEGLELERGDVIRHISLHF